MMIHIPFDHIKVLDDGNYGCTLKIGEKFYCAVYTPDWHCVKPLKESVFDPYANYTFIRDRGFLELSSYYYNNKLCTIDSVLTDLLDLKTEIAQQQITMDIRDYISNSDTTNPDDIAVVLFTIHYLNQDGDFAFELADSLAPYAVVSRAAIKCVFDQYKKCVFDSPKAMRKLTISFNPQGPIPEAVLALLELFDRIYKTIDSNKEERSNHLTLDLSTILLTLDTHESILFEYPQLIYQKYLEPFVSI